MKSTISHGWYGQTFQARIASHVQAWEQLQNSVSPRPSVTYPFITISREFGCEAVPVSRRLVQLLNEKADHRYPWVGYDRELLDEVGKQLHLHRNILDAVDGQRRSEMTELFDAILNFRVDDSVVFRKLAEVIRALAIHGHVVLVGRGSYWLTRDLHTGFHVQIIAPREWRTQKIARQRDLPVHEAEKIMMEGERLRDHYLNTYFSHAPNQGYRHDIILDNSRLTVEQMSEIIATAIHCKFPEKQ
jgi:cytidylate kinase